MDYDDCNDGENYNFIVREGFDPSYQSHFGYDKSIQQPEDLTDARPSSAHQSQSFNPNYQQSIHYLRGFSANSANRRAKKQFDSNSGMIFQVKGLQPSIPVSVTQYVQNNSAPKIQTADFLTGQLVSQGLAIQGTCNTQRTESIPPDFTYRKSLSNLYNCDINSNYDVKKQSFQSLTASFYKGNAPSRRSSKFFLPNGRDYLGYQFNKDEKGRHEYIAPVPSLNPKNNFISTHFQKIVQKPITATASQIVHAKPQKQLARNKIHSSQKSFQSVPLWSNNSSVMQENVIRNNAYSKRLERYASRFENVPFSEDHSDKRMTFAIKKVPIVPYKNEIYEDFKESPREIRSSVPQIKLKELNETKDLKVVQEEAGLSSRSSANTFRKYSHDRFTPH